MIRLKTQFANSFFALCMMLFVSLFFGCSHQIFQHRSSNQPPASTDVVVIGAGLSGLSAAYELKKAGFHVHILELTPRIGGRVRTSHYNINGENLTADSGMEEYWESNPAVSLLKELKLNMSHDVALSSIQLKNHLYEMGDENATQFMHKVFNAAEYSLLQEFKKKVSPIIHRIRVTDYIPNDQDAAMIKIPFSTWTMSQLNLIFKDLSKQNRLFARHRSAPEKVAEWIRISLECEIGTEWSRISALDGIAEFHIFLGASGTGEESYRVVGGNEGFANALADSIGTENISVNRRVTRVVRHGDTSEVFFIDMTSQQMGSIQAKAVISTIPIFRLTEIQFSPALSQTKWQAIQSQKYGSYFKAHIFVPHSAQTFWTKSGASILPILSDSTLGVIYDGNPTPSDGKPPRTKIISLLITGSQAEAFNFMPLDLARQNILSQFDTFWPGFSRQISGIEFYRYHPRAIASWPVGRSRFDSLSREIRRPENGVYLAGDFTESSHSDGAFLSAHRVAIQIIKDLEKHQ